MVDDRDGDLREMPAGALILLDPSQLLAVCPLGALLQEPSKALFTLAASWGTELGMASAAEERCPAYLAGMELGLYGSQLCADRRALSAS